MQEKQQKMKEDNMKNSSKHKVIEDGMRQEYDFSNSQPNKFADILKRQERLISIDADVFKVFDDSEKVNNTLRNLIKAMPKLQSNQMQ